MIGELNNVNSNDYNTISSSINGDNGNTLNGIENVGKNPLRPYFNPETFNAKYEARYIPKEGIIDSNGLPLVAKLKSLTSLVQQQQPSTLNSSNQNWWFKFKQDNSLGNNSSSINYGNSNNGNTLKNYGSDYYGQTVFSSFRDYLNLKKWSDFIKVFSYKFGKVYLKHLLIQPFVVSKTFLQVHDFTNVIDNKDGIEFHVPHSKDHQTNSDNDDEIVYFKNKDSNDLIPKRSAREHLDLELGYDKEGSAEVFVDGGTTYHKVYKIHPTDSSTRKVIESIYDVEGTFGIVRSNNTTFIYNFLSGTLEAWLNGFISPFLNIPDPNFVEVALSNNILSSILLVLSSTLITGIILLPLELINLKFIVTKMRHIHFTRSIREHIKNLKIKSFYKNLLTKPKNVKLLIFQALNRLNAAVYHKSLFQTVLLNRFLKIDKFTSYKRYETGNFLIKFAQLIVKVPLDNLYTREQLHFLLDKERSDEASSLPIENVKDLIIVPHKDIPLIAYFTNLNNFKGLWKGYKLELIGVGCGYLLSIIDVERDSVEEERF